MSRYETEDNIIGKEINLDSLINVTTGEFFSLTTDVSSKKAVVFFSMMDCPGCLNNETKYWEKIYNSDLINLYAVCVDSNKSAAEAQVFHGESCGRSECDVTGVIPPGNPGERNRSG